MSNPISPAEQWINWATGLVHNDAGLELVPAPDDRQLELPTADQLEVDPMYYYETAVAFLNHYNSYVGLWESVLEVLERKYGFLKNKAIMDLMQTQGKLTQTRAETIAVVQNESIREAITKATNLARVWKGRYYHAMNIKEFVSRGITARESDRRVMR